MAAVGEEIRSAVVGYEIKAGDFSESSPNLPQRVAVFAEANHANQGTLDVSEWRATTLKAVGDRYGYGSPAYQIARICLPRLGGIPLVFYPQAEAGGATAKVKTITPTGTATENATHTIRISGRNGIDGQFYNITIETGDNSADINDKISDTVNAVLGAPVSVTNTDYVSSLKAKWNGLTSNDLKVEMDDNGVPAGITYTIGDGASGAGTPNIGAAIALLGTKWNTLLINSYGTVSSVMSALEAFNGIPTDIPTGQYQGIIMRPLIALTGSTIEDPSSITDPRKAEVTIAICPAPLSEGFPFEAAANMCALYAPMAQNTPQLDPINQSYPDMPVPIDGVIGAMSIFTERDRILKEGCSTVDIVNGKYQIKDFVTTYHPDGELVPAFSYVRDLTVAFNIRYGYYLLEQINVVGKNIANDGDNVKTGTVVKPKMWKSVLANYFLDLVERGLIVDAAFSNSSLTVAISTTNSNRINTAFRTKLSGVARISSTTNELGFNFGSN